MSTERMGGEGAVLEVELERADRAGVAARAVILVEGVSDARAIAALARRMDRDLESDGVVIIPTAGATNVGAFVKILGPDGHDVALAALCDEAERHMFAESLLVAGARPATSAELERSGLFVCVPDLESEMIRAVGASGIQSVIADEGELSSFRRFQRQPAQRGRPIDAQLRRFLGTRSGRKIRYGRLLADAVDLARVPRPLDGVLGHVRSA